MVQAVNLYAILGTKGVIIEYLKEDVHRISHQNTCWLISEHLLFDHATNFWFGRHHPISISTFNSSDNSSEKVTSYKYILKLKQYVQVWQ